MIKIITLKKILQLSLMVLITGASVPTDVFAAQTSENIFYYFPTTGGYQSVEKNYTQIDILAPQIYTVGYDLKLGKAEKTDILKLAAEKQIDVMPLVVNANFNKILMSDLLRDTKAQDVLIKDLIQEARNRNFIGWQFDFENINHLDRDLYTDFVKRAYTQFKKRKLVFSVAVIPRSTDYNPDSFDQDWSSGYDIKNIAKYTNFISIMSYDDPQSYGPVASIGYVQKVLAHTLKDVPAKKISLGIPLYCWQWESNAQGTKKIANIKYSTAAQTKETYKNNNFVQNYSHAEQAELFMFSKGDENHHYIWCDNAQSFQAKKNIIKKFKLRGFSAWALGQEDPAIWKE
jgi:spore germination protein YaaH